MSKLLHLRKEYHRRICRDILGERNGVFNNADKESNTSQALARNIAERLPYPLCPAPPSGQTTERLFEKEAILQEKGHIAHLTPLRKKNRAPETLILHASISCKWTIRSDRSQNTRTEALNLIRNRRGTPAA